jgi:AraC-like DNA-binding protein
LNNKDHLTLRLARLKSSEELEQKEGGLTFLFSKGGVGRYTSRLATHRLTPGDILAFNASAGSKLAVFENKGEFLFWTFSVCFENLLPLFANSEVSLLHSVSKIYEAGKVYPASSPLAVECHRLLTVVPPQFNLDHRGQLVRIAATILSTEFKDGMAKRNGSFQPEDHMLQAFEKLSASELINLSVGELAERFSCSRRHLNRLFHQHFGASVAALRMEMRLLKAVSLLRDANIKIIHVAEQCGFNHLGLFNTCFKRRFGASPGQWRKSARQTAPSALGKPEAKPGQPLRYSELSPSNSQPPSAHPAVAASCAGKIADGEVILEDLKRRDLLFGPQTMANAESKPPEARRNE